MELYEKRQALLNELAKLDVEMALMKVEDTTDEVENKADFVRMVVDANRHINEEEYLEAIEAAIQANSLIREV